MKYLLLCTMCLLFLSCEKELELDGTTWRNESNSKQLEFSGNSCTCTLLNLNNPSSPISVTYQFEYKKPNISMYVAASTGFTNYEGTVSKNKMTLTQQLPIVSDESMTYIDGSVEVFYLK
jgi:hypothetical protein